MVSARCHGESGFLGFGHPQALSPSALCIPEYDTQVLCLLCRGEMSVQQFRFSFAGRYDDSDLLPLFDMF